MAPPLSPTARLTIAAFLTTYILLLSFISQPKAPGRVSVLLHAISLFAASLLPPAIGLILVKSVNLRPGLPPRNDGYGELGANNYTHAGWLAVVDKFLTMPFGEMKGRLAVRTGGGATECVICLEEFADGDVVQRLPACRHFFHRHCVRPWLDKHVTCPLCRLNLAHPTTAAVEMLTAAFKDATVVISSALAAVEAATPIEAVPKLEAGAVAIDAAVAAIETAASAVEAAAETEVLKQAAAELRRSIRLKVERVVQRRLSTINLAVVQSSSKSGLPAYPLQENH